jgi:mono/diheme cytochrome c family protein
MRQCRLRRGLRLSWTRRTSVRRLFKWLGIVVMVLVIVLGAAVGWVLASYDKDYSAMPRPALVASQDPAVIARGEYLFHAVAHCSACHTAPGVQRKRGDRPPAAGGRMFPGGPFGTFVARNLTADKETGLGAQSDGDIARAIRSGVDHQGRFIPIMKIVLGPMSDEDLTAVVSYVRTQAPERREEQPEQWGFLAKVLAATKLGPVTPAVPRAEPPSEQPSVARGAYLANGPAACHTCHSRFDPFDGWAMVGTPFTGGDVEADESDPTSEFAAPNLTPDPKTGRIAAWDEDTFVTRFRGGRAYAGSHMPWENFSEMTDADLRSLFRYLKSLPPVVRDTGPSHRPAGWRPAA